MPNASRDGRPDSVRYGSRIHVVLFGGATTGMMKGENVMWIDVATRRTSTPVGLGRDIHGVAVPPDGSRLYCADHDDARAPVLDVSRGQVRTVDVAARSPGSGVPPGVPSRCA